MTNILRYAVSIIPVSYDSDIYMHISIFIDIYTFITT